MLTDESGHHLIGACPPDETTTLDLVLVLLAYSRTQSEMLDENAFLTVGSAVGPAALRGNHGSRSGLPLKGNG